MIAIALFELRLRLRMVSTYVHFFVFFALALLVMAAAGGVFNTDMVMISNRLLLNGPYGLTLLITSLGLFGMMEVAALMGRSVQQDFEYGLHHFFFSMPLTKRSYLLGRFIGAWLTLALLFSGIGIGAHLGSLLPGMDPERLGPQSTLAYVLPYLHNLLPNLFIFGAVFFTLAALTRRMLPVYVAGVICLIGYLVAGPLMRDLDNKALAALLDPFGARAIMTVTEYWSVAEKNTLAVPVTGVYLANRLLWLAIAACVLGFGCWRFRFADALEGRAPKEPGDETDARPPAAPHYAPDFSRRSLLGLLLRSTWLNVRETAKNVYFFVIVLAGVLFMAGMATTMGRMYGTPTYPVTYQVLELLGGGFSLFMIIITTFYAGELVWREREARLAPMLDALPAPSWLPLLSKLFALIAVQALLLLVVMGCGMLTQLIKGYTHLEPLLYLQQLFLIQLPNYALLAVLAIALQVLVNHKYLAYLAMILYYIATIAAGMTGYDHPMALYANNPAIVYSDMNRYGHYLALEAWLDVYWGGLALFLTAVAFVFLVRGANDDWRTRLRVARRRLGPGVLAGMAGGLAIFLGAGAVLYYNLNVLNDYQSPAARDAAQARYERLYKRFEHVAQPRVAEVKLAVDLEPERRRAAVHGHYALHNRSGKPIRDLYVQLAEDPAAAKIRFSRRAQVLITDQKAGFYGYRLAEPLAPGARMAMDFDLAFAPKGVLGLGGDTPVRANGTFFTSTLLPHIGYQAMFELQGDRARKKQGLAKRTLPPRDDPRGLADNYVTNDADWIAFDATVSTSPDQIALAPGYLAREWMAGGRRHFHYTMDKPILNFYAFQSARYAVRHDEWNDVAIDIYYHPGHGYNLDTMIGSVKASLDYYTKHFGPYQHKQVRIVEFPRYASYAQSLPNTIPYSESIGFIAKVDQSNPKDVNFPYYVTAHEVAHQWWGHQLIGGRTRGATVLSETLAQYSALMVMKQTYGEARMRRFLRHELDRYLRGRGAENRAELPLADNEGQNYIHYNKGSLAMYLLQDMLGEDRVNAVLRDVLRRYGYKSAPYPSATVLVQALRAATPPELEYLIGDLFESIVLYENRAVSATAARRADGRYDVTLAVAAGKVRAGGLGDEKSVPLHDFIEIGVDGADGRPLLRERRLLTQANATFVLTVAGVPAKAGIDPDNKLVDRKPEDNTTAVAVR